MGAVATRESARLFQENRYDDYLHFTPVRRGRRGAREYWHKRMRQQLGIVEPDAAEMTTCSSRSTRQPLFVRLSACPNLEDQAKLLPLLEASAPRVVLSEEYQLVPEQSTSAVIVHHPGGEAQTTVTQ